MCRRAHEDHNEIVDCSKCQFPVLLPENEIVNEVYNLCRDQLIISFSGVIGFNLPAVKVAMDLLDIEDERQLGIWEKLQLVSKALFAKDQEEEEEEKKEEE